MSDIQRWADAQQYYAAPMEAQRTEDGNIIPTVHLLWMTPDPLGAVAAMCRMYAGVPTYSLRDITDAERYQYWADVQKTHLRAPLEAIKLHFFIEGVTRSFTHQMVRQRTAVYAQESLRFAVKEDLAQEISLPPSLAVLAEDDPRRVIWDRTVGEIHMGYNQLVNNGIPAEDARGLLPHAVTTRLNYVTDLRNLSDHAGNRLCTQAQFEWRVVFLGIVNAIRNYGTGDWEDGNDHGEWQYEAIADSSLFRPVCYQLQKCPFQASFDRHCSIRQRVEVLGKAGIPSEEWADPNMAGDFNYRILPEEWLLNPAAARIAGGSAGHD